MNIKRNNTISLILNIAMVVLVAYAISWFFTPEGMKEGVGNMEVGGVNCLQFFTIDSNILAAICSAMLIPFNIKAIRSGQNEIPSWAMILKFIGTVAVTLTFLVVVLFLGPTLGYDKAFENSCLELHLICPLIAIISFCFFDHGYKLSKRQFVLGIIPTLIYGSVYLTKVIILKTWPDFYNFNMGGLWYISMVVLPIVTYLIAIVIGKWHNTNEI